MNRKHLFWIGTLALSVFVGTLPADAGQTRTTTKTATHAKAKPAPAYSARVALKRFNCLNCHGGLVTAPAFGRY